jgi:hypothetical protein
MSFSINVHTNSLNIFQEASLSIQSLQTSTLSGNPNNYMELLQRLLVGSLMATTEPSILSRTAGIASVPGIHPIIPMNTAALTSPSNTSSPDSGLGADVHHLPHDNLHNDILQRLAKNLGASHLHTTRTLSNPITNPATLTQHLMSKTSIIGELHPGGVHQQRKSNEIFKFRVCSPSLIRG